MIFCRAICLPFSIIWLIFDVKNIYLHCRSSLLNQPKMYGEDYISISKWSSFKPNTYRISTAKKDKRSEVFFWIKLHNPENPQTTQQKWQVAAWHRCGLLNEHYISDPSPKSVDPKMKIRFFADLARTDSHKYLILAFQNLP